MSDYAGEHVWIIGAGDGIGRAVAVELSHRGALLLLSGRNRDKLEALNAELGGGHQILPFDVRDAIQVRDAAASAGKAFPHYDRLLFLAGQYQPMTLDALDLEVTLAIIETNLIGAFNVIAAVLPLFLGQGRGQIALCGSIAGYCGLPNSQPYAATKAALINLAESLRSETIKRGLDIRLISPGFVRTRLTAKNSFRMPAIMEPEEAARRIADGLRGAAFEIAFPRRLALPLKFLSMLPRRLFFLMVRA